MKCELKELNKYEYFKTVIKKRLTTNEHSYDIVSDLLEIVELRQPKKVIFDDIYFCPNCNQDWDYGMRSFCVSCGQALDWSNDNE